MRKKTWLLCGAAMTFVALSAPAQAASRPSQADAQAAEIRLLREQVEALTQRLNAQEAAQREIQEQAAQAQAAAQEAQAATEQSIQTLPTQINSAVAALPKAKSWADDTKVSGRMYYDLTHINAKSDGVKVKPSGTGFDIKRFYIGVDHKFNDMFSGNITTDFQYSSAISSTHLYIKKAYLQAKVNDNLTIRLGATDLPWVPYAESVYGYRHIENTLIDRTKFGTSADWGVHASGDIGPVSYAVAVIDGAGYRSPLRSKGMDVEARLSTKIDKINLGIGGYTGKLGKDVQGATTFHTASRFNALAAYVDPKFRVGVEYFATENWSNVTTAASDKADGYSVFGSYNVTDKVSVFGRYDRVNPNETTASSKTDDYFNLGVQYSPTKIVDFALVYKRDQVENGTLSTSNGTIGGANKGVYDEIGLFGQFRW